MDDTAADALRHGDGSKRAKGKASHFVSQDSSPRGANAAMHRGALALRELNFSDKAPSYAPQLSLRDVGERIYGLKLPECRLLTIAKIITERATDGTSRPLQIVSGPSGQSSRAGNSHPGSRAFLVFFER